MAGEEIDYVRSYDTITSINTKSFPSLKMEWLFYVLVTPYSSEIGKRCRGEHLAAGTRFLEYLLLPLLSATLAVSH